MIYPFCSLKYNLLDQPENFDYLKCIMKIITLLVLIALISPKTFAIDCKSTSVKKYLNMDYKSFDQSPPNGGWRELANKERDLEIAEIIDGYLQCRKGLTNEQKATLVFHTGQIYADLGKTNLAIDRMKKAYNEKLDKKYHWNLFVDGTIAFLQHDLKKLKEDHAKILSAESDHPYVETLNNLIRCFNRPYKEIDLCINEKTEKLPQTPSATR